PGMAALVTPPPRPWDRWYRTTRAGPSEHRERSLPEEPEEQPREDAEQQREEDGRDHSDPGDRVPFDRQGLRRILHVHEDDHADVEERRDHRRDHRYQNQRP